MLWKGAAIAALAIVAVLLETRFHLGARLSPSRIEEWLQSAGALAPALFILVMAAAVVSPLPTFPLDVLAGRLFGPYLGTLYAVTGATLGAAASFALARGLGRELVARFLSGHIAFCRQCSDKLLAKVVFLARLVPMVSFDMVSYGAGLTSMSLPAFATASFLGMLPLTFVYASVGPLLSIGPAAAWAGGLVVVGLFFLLPRWIERRDPFGILRVFRHPEEPADVGRPPADR